MFVIVQHSLREGLGNDVMAASSLAFPKAPGNCKASRTPGCNFIKVWNERSVTRPSCTWHPAAGPFFPAPSAQPLGSWWLGCESLFHESPRGTPLLLFLPLIQILIPDRSVRWKPRLWRLLINAAPLYVYGSVYQISRVGKDGFAQRWSCLRRWV